MVASKDEYLAAGIRKQIAYLEGLLQELESDPERTADAAQRIRDVETKLRGLRNQL